MASPRSNGDWSLTMKTRAAFSLLEVVFAVAVLVGGVVSLLALLTPVASVEARAPSAAIAREVAASVPRELERIRDMAEGSPTTTRLDFVAASVGESGLRLVASAAGAPLLLESEAGSGGGLPAGLQYYLVEVTPMPEPWRYHSGSGFLALHVTVSWPYRLPAGGATSEAVVTNPDAREALHLRFVLTP